MFICKITQHLSSAIVLAKNLKTGIDARLFHAYAYSNDFECALEISIGTWQDIGTATDWMDLAIATPSTVVLDDYFKDTTIYFYAFQIF